MVKEKLTILLLILSFCIFSFAQEQKSFHYFEIKNHYSKSFVPERQFNDLIINQKIAVSGEISYRYLRRFKKYSIESGISIGSFGTKWYYQTTYTVYANIHDINFNIYNYNPYLQIPLLLSYWHQIDKRFFLKGSLGSHFLLYSWDSIIYNLWGDSEKIFTLDLDYITNFKSGYSINIYLLQKDKKNNYFSYGLSFNDKLGKGTRGMVTYYVNDEVIQDEMHGNNWYIGFSFGYMF